MANDFRIDAFKQDGDILCFLERIEQYFEANETKIEKRCSILLISLHEDVYKILKNMCHPKMPKELSYEELQNLLKLRFEKRISHFRKRIQFEKLQQLEGESIAKWYARVREFAAGCNFTNTLEERVKDKFVTSLRPGPIQEKLCEQDVSKSVAFLVDTALNKEMALKEVQEVHQVAQYGHAKTNKSSQNTFKETGKKQDGESSLLKCIHCGKPNHNFSKCKFKSFKCKICNKIGHLAIICKSKGQTHNVEVKEDTFNNSIDIFAIEKNVNYVLPISIKCCIDNKPVQMELDTGAAISCLPENIYLSKFSHIKLENSDIELKTYNGHILKPVGEINCRIKVKDKEVNCSMVIVKNGCKILFGRDLIQKFNLDISKFLQIHYVQSTEEKLQLLLQEFDILFKSELGIIKGEEITLELIDRDVKPIFHKPRQVPHAFKEQVESELTRLEKEGVITKVETSQWGTPLVPVLKENNKIRLCANYKVTVNKHIKDVNHPLPRIEDIFTALQGGTSFSKLDLRNAFNHLCLSKESSELLAWSTPKGIYRVNRLPYGTKPASAIFQNKLEKVLLGARGVVNFIDDVLVTGTNDVEHLENLKEVLRRFKEAGIRLNKSKCEFMQPKIKYLGHFISKSGLSKDMSKVDSVVNAPAPKNVSEVRSWLGMVNYYGKFIHNLSIKLKPLYDLLQKNHKFYWNRECQKSFNTIKKDIISDNVLIHYSRDMPLRLACDASQNGIGAVLSHILPDGSDRPISFISRVFSKAEKSYSMIHKEALAIYWAVQKFYQYLIGRKFELLSDHKPLLALFGEHKSLPQMAAGRLQRWSLYLSNFDYTFKHVKGIENVKADCMSRLPLPLGVSDNNRKEYDYINFIEDQNVIDLNLVRSETRKDPVLSNVYNMVRYGFPKHVNSEVLKPYLNRKSELYIENGVIMWGYRVVIPNKLQKNMLHELHVSHEGIVKMKNNARSYFWFPNLDSTIENFVKSCQVCMSARPEPQKSKIITWPKANFPYERVHADFLGPISGKMILIIIDCYTKWPEAFIVKNLESNTTVEKFRECFSRFGLPKVVVTDNAATFCSKEFSEFLSKNGIQHETSPPFHPATNGFAENAVKSFKNAMYKSLNDVRNRNVSFVTLMNRYLFHYRNSIHCITNISPSEAMFNRKLRSRLDLLSTKKDKKQCNVGKRDEKFKEGEYAYCRDYRNPNKKKFVKCVIDEVLGQRTYLCRVLEENLIWKRHLDQIISSWPQDQKENLNETSSVVDDSLLQNFKDLRDNNYDKQIVHNDESNIIVNEPISEILQEVNDNVNIIPESFNKVSEVSPHISKTWNSTYENLPVNQPVVSCNNENQTLRRSERQRKAPQRLNL